MLYFGKSYNEEFIGTWLSLRTLKTVTFYITRMLIVVFNKLIHVSCWLHLHKLGAYSASV